MSADNHRGQEAKTFHQQAGYMRAMISSYINDQMSCKRSGSIYVGRYDYKDAYTEVGGRATQDAKAEVIGTTPGKEEVEQRQEQLSRVESGTETESNAWSSYREILGSSF